MASSTLSRPPVVLIVEDEALLRMHAVDLIEDAGFTVAEARNADEAIEILKSRTDICIVFTDIDMPGSMDGLKLAAFVRGRWPPIELIITSGFTTPLPEEIPARGHFFAKPYDDGKVVAAIRGFVA